MVGRLVAVPEQRPLVSELDGFGVDADERPVGAVPEQARRRIP
jgi:hypothetical protein